MTLLPGFYLKIGSMDVKWLKALKVTSSRKLPCDQAEIELPMMKDITLSSFKLGDEVLIKLGNDRIGLASVFLGVVTWISPTLPLTIKTEDYFEIAKKTFITKSYIAQTYSAVARDVIEGCGLIPEIPEEHEGVNTLYLNHRTAAQVMEKLKERTGWDYWVIPTTRKVYFGRAFPGRDALNQDMIRIFKFGHNVIEQGGLRYRQAKKVGKVVVWLSDSDFKGGAVKGEYGTGEPVRTFGFSEHIGDGKGAQKAEKKAMLLYKQLNSSQYEGSFKTFGDARVKHSHEIKLEDPDHAERSGYYNVDQVVYEYGEGCKMEVWLRKPFEEA